MGRSAIFESLFSAMSADPQLLPLLQGSGYPNQRLYRDFPKLQLFLKGYEPQVSEGWLVLEEAQPGLRAAQTQYSTIYEALEVNFHVFGTTYGLADDVSDILDSLFGWTVEQQRDVQYGDYFVLFSRAYQTFEKYAQEIKLPQKTRQYRLELVKAVQVA